MVKSFFRKQCVSGLIMSQMDNQGVNQKFLVQNVGDKSFFSKQLARGFVQKVEYAKNAQKCKSYNIRCMR